MKLEYEKNIRIVSDLMGYCYFLGAHELSCDIRLQDEYSVITVQALVPDLPPGILAEMDRLLNLPRQREMEQNYWNISGEEQIDGELLLAAVMVDSAGVQYKNGWLTINAWRKSSGE